MKSIVAHAFSVGASLEELTVLSENCPVKRHDEEECTCIMKNSRSVTVPACEYYKGYKETEKNKQTTVLIQCAGEGKTLTSPTTHQPEEIREEDELEESDLTLFDF